MTIMRKNSIAPLPEIDEEIYSKPDFHAVASIKLGELILDGVIDWNKEEWTWDSYNDEQYKRLCKKIERRYWDREISVLPVGQWRREFIRTINEIMPKYKKLYDIIDNVDILQQKDKYGKNRTVNSSFPQTQLSGKSDYASSGKDHQYEDIEQGDVIDKFNEFDKNYNDVDVMILNKLEILFSPFLAVNINAF